MAHEYAELINDEIKKDEGEFEQLRNRSVALTTLTSALVALTTGLLAIAAGSQKDVLPDNSRWSLAAALSAFLVAGVLALAINFPQSIERPDEAALRQLVDERWEDEDAEQRVAEVRVTYITSLRKANDQGTLLLAWAIGAEIVGVALTALTAFFILGHLS